MDSALRALNRFGLGARIGERRQITDPRGWLRAQLDGGAPVLRAADSISPGAIGDALRGLRAVNQSSQQERRQMRRRLVDIAAGEADLALTARVTSDRPFVERLVAFWSNHLCVSTGAKLLVAPLAGSYERDAIRPHVLGRFEDMLLASARHPAMLIYLDNFQSIGPASPAGRAGQRNAGARRGLNENYARELFELHTLGVDGGYSQQDVVEVARAFTGWTIGRPVDPGFRFLAAMHDPGTKMVLGHTLAAGRGIEDGERVLDILAAHPATARHISFKLAQRFVSDAPPADLVDRAAQTFTRTKGNLREVVRTIATSPEFFAPAAYRAKVKTPFEFVVSALRATSADVRQATATVRALAGLGMPLYLCQPPTGYDETAEAWVSSGALVNRMNFALAVSGGQMRGIVVSGLSSGGVDQSRGRIVRDALAGDVSASTLDTVAKAATAEQAIALVIGSPEFQRQ